jgi:hypothetical protein
MSTTAYTSNDSHKIQFFLDFVAGGQQDEAERLLKETPKLALMTGNVTDHAGRVFENITGFQYALWALDWRMWEMVRKYLPYRAAGKQVEKFIKSKWAKEHGEHANWKELLDALQAYCNEYKKYGGVTYHWVLCVGKSQYKLPIHVLQEYCNPWRPFNTCLNFAAPCALVRKLPCWVTDGIKKNRFDFGIFRYDRDKASFCTEVYSSELESYLPVARVDRNALSSLYDIRVRQRRQLIENLILGQLLGSDVVEKDGKIHTLLFQPTALNDLVLKYLGIDPK